MAEFRIRVIVDPSGAREGTRRVNDEINRTANAADRLRNLINRAFAFAGITIGIRQLIQLTDTFTNLENRIRTVTQSQQELEAVTAALFDVSNRTRASFESTVEVYARTALATRNLGLTQQQTIQFTESLNQAVILSGASAIEANNALIQLSQGLASGALRGDELRSVLEQLPVVADVIAESLNVTRGELRELGADGRISADIIIRAFQEAQQQLEADFGQTVPTISQAFVVFNNNLVRTIGELNATTGASAALANAIIFLANNMETLLRIVVLVSTALAIDFARRGIGAAIVGVRALTVAIAANPLGALAVAATAIISTLVAFSDEIEVTADGLVTLRDVGIAAFQLISEQVSRFITFFTTNFSIVSTFAAGVFGEINLSFDEVVFFLTESANRLISIFIGAFNSIVATFTRLPRVLAEIFIDAFNGVISITENSINAIISGINDAFDIGGISISPVELDRLNNSFSGAGRELGQAISQAFDDAFDIRAATDALEALGERSREIAQQRIAEQREPAALEPVAPTAIPDLGARNQALEDQRELLEAIRGPQDQLNRDLAALNVLQQQGAITGDEFNRVLQELRFAQAELNIEFGQGTFADGFILAIEEMILASQNFEAVAGEAFGNFFNSTIEGFSRAAAEAIVFGNDFEESIGNVARQAISDLLASLIQLGIQFAINAAIGQTLGAAATTAGVTQAGVLAAAFATPAAFASLASFGANAVPASAAITGTVALSQGLAALPGFQTGGQLMVGGAGGPDSQLVQFRATPGELISIETPGQRSRRDGDGSASSADSGPVVANFIDPNLFEDFLTSRAGQRILTNVIGRNAGSVNQALQSG